MYNGLEDQYNISLQRLTSFLVIQIMNCLRMNKYATKISLLSYTGAILICCSMAFAVNAQSLDDVAAATRTFAIEDVRIVQQPGQVLEKATIIIRDGLITAVGPKVKIPFDAERIPGDSLTVYAGFIDGLSHAGIPEPKRAENGNSQDNEKVSKANPPNDRAGIQPERKAYELLNTEDKSISALRGAGFTTAHIVPHGQMLPGTGTIVLLAGSSSNKMVLKREVSMFAQLTGARGVYPATPMGVMAKMRQLYREASRRKQMEVLYASKVTNIPRPEYDAAHYAFFPVIDGDLPIFMNTTSALDIYRALRLQETLGYPLILSGLYEGFESVDRLLEANVPLFLTLKLPKEPGEEKKGEEKSEEGEEGEGDASKGQVAESAEPLPPYDPRLHVTDHTDTENERINLEARRKIFHQQYVATAAMMYDAGLNFGFSTMDVKASEVHPNIRKMIDAGLTADVALAALTTNPARTFGLSRSMGSVEEGKMANLVVTKGPLFDEPTKIKYVFVDGQKFEYNMDKKATDKTSEEK